MVPLPDGEHWPNRTGAIFRSDDRRAILLHIRKQRLGYLSQARCRREDADRLHADGSFSPRRWSRSLDPAGATGPRQRTAPGFSREFGYVLRLTSWGSVLESGETAKLCPD